MEYVIGSFWSGMELTCCYLFNSSFLSSKETGKKTIPIVLFVWLFACFYTNIAINQYIKLVLTLTISTVLSMILLQGTFAVHVCLVLICNIFIASMDAAAVHGMCYLLKISYDVFIWRKLAYTTLVTADKFLVLFLVWILNHYRKKGNLGKQHSKWILLSIVFPVVSAVMLAFLFYTAPRDKDVSLGIIVFTGILMIANIAMIYVINNIEKATDQEQELRLLRQQISIQTENFGALKRSYSIQRKSTHEFERHMQVLRDLLEHKEYESARDYVCHVQANRTLKVFSISSNNPVIDVVLNQKHQVALENGINMQVKVNDLSTVDIQNDELVVLLSNLLDNAIEACLKLENNKEIVCSIIKENGIYISIRNTSKAVTIHHGEISTTKQNATEHGYGLPAVKYILNQLNAEYTFAYQNGWFQFVAEIQE